MVGWKIMDEWMINIGWIISIAGWLDERMVTMKSLWDFG